jgi:hypothetical protein
VPLQNKLEDDINLLKSHALPSLSAIRTEIELLIKSQSDCKKPRWFQNEDNLSAIIGRVVESQIS